MEQHPIPKAMYAWNSIHAGSFIVFAKSLDNCYKFFFLPGPTEFFMTFEDFATAFNTKVLELVEVLPDQIYDDIKQHVLWTGNVAPKL
jgi:hypothetical protein